MGRSRSVDESEWFVGGLPTTTTDDLLQVTFARFGEVRRVEIIRDRATGASRGFGFVTLKAVPPPTPTTFQDLKIDGRRLHVSPKVNKAERGQAFFVGGLPSEADEQDLRNAFTPFGTVVDAKVARDRDSRRSRGFGFVTFSAQDTLSEADLSEAVVRQRRVRVSEEKGREDSLPSRGVSARGKSDRTDAPVGPTAPANLAPAQATWVEMRTSDEKSSAVLVKYDAEESARILKRLGDLEFNGGALWHGGNVGTAIVDQLGSASGLVASGLQAGQIFQVIGTPQLVEGLRAGSYALMQTAQGTLGTVVSTSSGQIAGQLRFAQASMAPVLAPVLAWQVLHAIAGTTQLKKINQRLDVMQRRLETLQARHEAEVLGEIRWAVKALDDILAERANTGTFTPEMDTRLAHVEKSIGWILERNRALVELFRSKAAAVHRLGGKSGAVRAATLLHEDAPQAIHDMELLMGLVAADLRMEEARLYSTMERNPKDVQRRLERVTSKVEEYRQVLDDLPSVEGLQRHAKACIDEMGWWQHKVFARGVAKNVEETKSLRLRDVRPPKAKVRQGEGGSYLFWKDAAGSTQVRLLPEPEEDT